MSKLKLLFILTLGLVIQLRAQHNFRFASNIILGNVDSYIEFNNLPTYHLGVEYLNKFSKEIKIFNIFGQLIINLSNIQEKQVVINTPDLSNGTYVIQVNTEKNYLTEKIVKR